MRFSTIDLILFGVYYVLAVSIMAPIASAVLYEIFWS